MLNALSLFVSMNDRLPIVNYNLNHKINHTDEYINSVKGNVTEHVTTLLSTPRNRRLGIDFNEHCSTLLYTPSDLSIIEIIHFSTHSGEYPRKKKWH